MIEYITLGLVLLKYALDYIAPKTKTKVDDRARDVADLLPLPSLGTAAKAAKDQFEKDTAEDPQPVVTTRPDGATVRDHR